jgi:pyruvate/2-oxoglutarate dehydrogenase complex dihydrolipoamide dehydrogenase (E3) component
MAAYDFTVIGGGSAGYNAARAAAELGMRVAVVDGARRLGGLCILRGCMPSKTLLHVTDVLHEARAAQTLGLRIPRASPDMKAVQARKRRIVADFAGYRRRDLEDGPFTLVRSPASFMDRGTLALAGGRRLKSRFFLVATGSRVSVPPIPGLADTPFWTSDDVLELDFVPRSVIVLGGGVVACELAQYLRRIGSRVTLIQRSPRLLREHSEDAAGVVRKSFEDDGMEVITGTRIEGIARRGRGVRVTFAHGGKSVVRSADHLFNALGREPDTAGLNLAAAGVKAAPGGRIRINRWQQTSTPGIYAAGDCSGPVEIVHVAIEQGTLAARHAAGVAGLKPIDYGRLLCVAFTDPPVAAIGRLEQELAGHGTRFLSASHSFGDHGKSILMEATRGYVKVVADPAGGRILGAEIVGRDAGELIHCFTAPMAMRATVFDMLRASWYHPTLAEILTYPLEEIAARVVRR